MVAAIAPVMYRTQSQPAKFDMLAASSAAAGGGAAGFVTPSEAGGGGSGGGRWPGARTGGAAPGLSALLRGIVGPAAAAPAPGAATPYTAVAAAAAKGHHQGGPCWHLSHGGQRVWRGVAPKLATARRCIRQTTEAHNVHHQRRRSFKEAPAGTRTAGSSAFGTDSSKNNPGLPNAAFFGSSHRDSVQMRQRQYTNTANPTRAWDKLCTLVDKE